MIPRKGLDIIGQGVLSHYVTLCEQIAVLFILLSLMMLSSIADDVHEPFGIANLDYYLT